MFREIMPRFSESLDLAKVLAESFNPVYATNKIGRTDVQENDEGFIFTIDLPGVEKDKVDIKLTQDVLTITAERNSEKARSNYRYAFTERQSGKFERSFLVPPIDEASIKATMRDGILSITMKKLREERGRRINID